MAKRSLIRPDLVEIIRQHAGKLELPSVFVVDGTYQPVDKEIMLGAFSICESSGGYNKPPRFEPAYGPGGRYYKVSELQRNLYEKYGKDASSSWSSFQVMFLVYHELGFTGATPTKADDDNYSLPVAIKLFNKRILRLGPKFLSQAGDAYNSGNFKDANVPVDYIKKLLNNYKLVQKSGLFTKQDV
jgi:hypothetical protein